MSAPTPGPDPRTAAAGQDDLTAAAEADPRPARVHDVRSIALTGLLVLAVFYTLYIGSHFFLPIVLALVLNLLLGPIVQGLCRLRVPRGLGAGLVVLGLVAILTGTGYLLAGPALEWMEKAPQSLRRVELKLRPIKEPVAKVREATKQVEKLTSVDGEGRAGPRQVELKEGDLNQLLLERARSLTVAMVVMLILLYFLLASGDLFLRKLIRVLATLEDKRKAVEIARRAQSDISKYLITITLINVGLGVAVAVALYFLGVPNPPLWGALAALLNFIPYVGAIAGILTIGLVSVLTFEEPLAMALPPLAYFLLTAIEGYFVTPMVLGRQLTLNPVVILLGLMLWSWIWGIAGAVLAVPLLVGLKIFCDYSERLHGVGEFLGR